MEHEEIQPPKVRSDPAGDGTATATPPKVNRRLLAVQVVVVLIALVSSVVAVPFAPQIREHAGPAYAVLFVLSIQSGALFMVPGFGWAGVAAFSLALGDVWGPALVGTTGQVIGEMVAYLIGATGSPWIRRQRFYRRVEGWLRRWGLWAVVVIAALPNPVFDIVGALAGAASLGWWRFFVASWAGRLLKNLGIAIAAVEGAELIQQFFP